MELESFVQSDSKSISQLDVTDKIGYASPSPSDSPTLSLISDSGSEKICDSSETEVFEDRQYTGTFEGPEKSLEVCFKLGIGHVNGCRQLSAGDLSEICSRAKCSILSKISNRYLDAYVLSESSLFVYRNKILIKTCGTTTLLRCIPYLLQQTRNVLGMELEWIGYSRKNFMFPNDQLFPHLSFDQELNYLKGQEHLSSQINGSGHILGPVTGDHWFVYVADVNDHQDFKAVKRIVNIMMFDLHPKNAETFYRQGNDGFNEAVRMTKESGIYDLVPGALIDATAFEPCGYSMNAIQFDSYYTIHVTPEPTCSYASFETNNPFKSYQSIINNVLNVFRPRRFVLTMMTNDAGIETMHENPFEQLSVSIPNFGPYKRTTMSSTKVDGNCCCFVANYFLKVNKSTLYRSRSQSHFH